MASYRVRHPLRLGATLVIALVVVGFALFKFWPRDSGPDLSVPAATPCWQKCSSTNPVAFSFPFRSEQERTDFAAIAQVAPDSDTFITGYAETRGVPVVFDAYLPEGDLAPDSPLVGENYTEAGVDGAPGYSYRSAAVVPSARTPATVDGIADSDAAEEPRVSLIFSRSEATPTPQEKWVRVWGYLYWTSGELVPTAKENLAAVLVGHWEPVSQAELRAPAERVVRTKLVFRQGAIQGSVDAIEFSPTETRVKMSMRNLSLADELATWNMESVRLVLPDSTQLSPAPSEGSPENFDPTNVEPSTGANPLLRTGYLYFPAVNANDPLVLVLPAMSGAETLRIAIPGSRASK